MNKKDSSFAWEDYIKMHMPPRAADGHKGSFGRAFAVAGSYRYRGAAALAVLGALRTGVGFVTLCTEEAVVRTVGLQTPEVLFDVMPPHTEWTAHDVQTIVDKTATQDAVLVGCGCGISEGLYDLIRALLQKPGCPLLLDADGINVLAAHREEAEQLLLSACRTVLLTPHPVEFSRLSGIPLAQIQEDRMAQAAAFAQKTGVCLLLKGAGTVVAAGEEVTVNPTGNTALSKAGSGDVLSGVIVSLLAQGVAAPDALRMGAYLHGKAGDVLSQTLSEYGVTPSDLPRQIALLLSEILQNN